MWLILLCTFEETQDISCIFLSGAVMTLSFSLEGLSNTPETTEPWLAFFTELLGLFIPIGSIPCSITLCLFLRVPASCCCLDPAGMRYQQSSDPAWRLGDRSYVGSIMARGWEMIKPWGKNAKVYCFLAKRQKLISGIIFILRYHGSTFRVKSCNLWAGLEVFCSRKETTSKMGLVCHMIQVLRIQFCFQDLSSFCREVKWGSPLHLWNLWWQHESLQFPPGKWLALGFFKFWIYCSVRRRRNRLLVRSCFHLIPYCPGLMSSYEEPSSFWRYPFQLLALKLGK